MSPIMGTEQRKNIRFLVDDNIIVAIRNGVTKIGKLKDISLRGLSFEHIYEEDLSGEPLKSDIFLLGAKEFPLSKIPCKVVYNIPMPIPSEYEEFIIHFVTRRCGVQFEALNEIQMTQLNFFLKTYTNGTALPTIT